MLDEFRSTNITWDKATSRIYSPVTANASDENGRKLVVQIVNGGQVEDLTGATLHLYWETRDKTHDGLDVFKAIDLKKGEFELSYTTGMLSNHGVLNANLVLIDTVGRVVSERFKITVTEGIDDDAIQSENSFTTLTQALIDISNLEQNYTLGLNDLTAQLQQTEQELSSQLAQKVGGANKATMDDLGQDVKEALTGGAVAVVGIGAVGTPNVQTKAITAVKTDFLEQGKNQFDKTKVIHGYVVIEGSGNLSASPTNGVSAPINVKGRTHVTRSIDHRTVFQREDHSYLSGHRDVNGETYTLAIPEDAAWMISTVPLVDLDNFQVEFGTERTPYERYMQTMESLNVTKENLEKKFVDTSFVTDEFILLNDIPTKSTKQTVIFNTDGTVQKTQHRTTVGGALVREDVYSYEPNLITEVRTLTASGVTLTFKYNLSTLETEVI